MLHFNGKTFAPLGTQPSASAIGFYQALGKRGIHLYKPNGDLEAYIVANPKQGQFIVSASRVNGAPRYMHSTCSLTERWLGIENMGLTATQEAIQALQLVAKEGTTDEPPH